MELEELFGLPAHPFLVHAAVVMLPLAVLATLGAALPRVRRQAAPVALALAAVATIAVALTQQSGESLEERVDETELVEEHAEQGERVLPWAIAVTVVAAGAVAAEPLRRRYPNITARRATTLLVTVALLTGAGAPSGRWRSWGTAAPRRRGTTSPPGSLTASTRGRANATTTSRRAGRTSPGSRG